MRWVLTVDRALFWVVRIQKRLRYSPYLHGNSHFSRWETQIKQRQFRWGKGVGMWWKITGAGWSGMDSWDGHCWTEPWGLGRSQPGKEPGRKHRILMRGETSTKLVRLRPSWHVWEGQRKPLWPSRATCVKMWKERWGRWAATTLAVHGGACASPWVQWKGLEV